MKSETRQMNSPPVFLNLMSQGGVCMCFPDDFMQAAQDFAEFKIATEDEVFGEFDDDDDNDDDDH